MKILFATADSSDEENTANCIASTITAGWQLLESLRSPFSSKTRNSPISKAILIVLFRPG